MDTSDIKDEDMVEIVANANKPKFISVVHPSSISNKGPGVVYISQATARPRCDTCKGNQCLHLSTYEAARRQLEGESNDAKKKLRKTAIQNITIANAKGNNDPVPSKLPNKKVR